MTALTLNHEFGQMRGRFQRTLVVSIALHALLLVLLIAVRDLAPLRDQVVEISWLDQELPAPVVVTPEPEPVPETIAVKVPTPPSLSVKERLAQAGHDRTAVRDKLARLDPSPVTDRAAALEPSSPNLLNTARATMAPVVRSGPPANLNRGPAAQQQAVALTRGPASSSRATAVVAATTVDGGGDAAPARPGAEASPAVRDLGGATITGLVADRRVEHHIMPTYPEWAMTQAVEGVVTLQFVVLPTGTVKPGVQVQKTAGFQDFDDNAAAAIRQWRFAPLTGSEAREQWGTITFRYRLHD